MTAAPPTPAELMAVGRLQAVALIVAELSRALDALADRMAMDDPGWRVRAFSALRPVKAAADQRATLTGLPGRVESERRAVVAALEHVAATVAMAEHAVAASNEPTFRIMVKHRLPLGLGALDRALRAVTAGAVARQAPARMAAGFAC